MASKQSCESCRYLSTPLSDIQGWEKIRDAHAKVMPEYSDNTIDHITNVEMQMRTGMDANMEDCPGYKGGRLLLGLLKDKLSGMEEPVFNDAGMRLVSAAERHCQNPFLLTEEYGRLADELTRQSADRYDVSHQAVLDT